MVMNDGDSRDVAIRMMEVMSTIECSHMRPCVIFRPSLTKVNRRWRAHYGSISALSVHATGNSPEEAMKNFDVAWVKNLEAT